MFNFLRPFIAPAVAPFIGALLAWLANHYGIQYTPEQQGQIREGVVTAILALFATAASATGIIKTAINKKINPANAASSQLASAGKQENKVEIARQTAEQKIP